VGLVLPFVALLAAIALGPWVAPAWWRRPGHQLIVSGVLGAPVVGVYLNRDPRALLDGAGEYVSFIVLLASLYAITGGIRLRGDLPATPLTNTTFLAAGAVLASLIGTTGASMLLIRPLLQTNRQRRHVRHTVVFSIFLAANIGGALTPLGDPPLFLGYLRGVPFTWTFGLWRPWLLAVGTLLLVYFVWDWRAYGRESRAALRRDRAQVQPLRLEGALNGAALVGVVLAVALLRPPAREAALVALAGLSLALTPRAIHRANAVTAAPILEVAALFLGIFATMRPALDLLRAQAPTLGLREPWHFFWATGLVSSVLDNAPTYLVFLALAQGLGLPDDVAGVSRGVLTAISLGAVFMGANTYIGNAPNLMVKAIAAEAGVPMPGFVGYLAYSGLVLLPLFAGLTLLFLR
jgi:Na+/H+ antiporter NhaD/arsenite permease-like protein